MSSTIHAIDCGPEKTLDLQRRFPFPTRDRYECEATEVAGLDPSPALASHPLPQRAGGADLTDGQKVALLNRRGSDWSKAVLSHLRAFGKAECGSADYQALVGKGLAESRGSYHVLTSHGRWRADQVAIELARAEGLHVMTYSAGRRGAKAGSARCTCGWSSRIAAYARDHLFTLRRHGREHLEAVGQFVAREA